MNGLTFANAEPILNAELGYGTEAASGFIMVDFTTMTQYESVTNVDTNLGAVDGTGAGNSAGTMMGYDIGTDGKINAYYSNGDMKLLGQVVVADFVNTAGLSKAGDNLFTATANSGEFDGIGQVGIFQTGVLEMSNVDLSAQFVDMIVTQRGFQANSRTITTSDEMIQEMLNLK